MHLNNYGLKAIRAVYFEKLRLYEDSTKYANDVDVSRSAENVLLNVDDLLDANSIDDIHEVDYDFTPNNKHNKSGKFDTYKKYNDDIKKRIVKITGEPPKNNVHVGSIVFTLPDEFKNASKKEQVDVFKNWLRFIGDRYGNENIIDCVLHFDETTPHGTVTIVPEAISRKTHKKTVSTASCFTIKDLHNLHKDCDAYFERIYGVEGLINNQKTIGRTKVAKQHLDAFKKEHAEYEALTKQNNELKAENQLLQGAVDVKRAEYDKLDTDVKNTLDEANNKANDIKSKASVEAEQIKRAANVGINKRVKELNTREADLLQREYEKKTDSNFFYDNVWPDYKKKKKKLEEKEKELNKKEKDLQATEIQLNDRANALAEKFRYYDRYINFLEFGVKIWKFTQSDYFTPHLRDADDLMKTFINERDRRLAYQYTYGLLDDKYSKTDKTAIINDINKQVEAWKRQEKEEGFEPFKG